MPIVILGMQRTGNPPGGIEVRLILRVSWAGYRVVLLRLVQDPIVQVVQD
ncbi:MAG: hypothetical protein AAGH40_05825 [Verrucomicrobiota bacterium]